jgi:hypothetical protein
MMVVLFCGCMVPGGALGVLLPLLLCMALIDIMVLVASCAHGSTL